MGFFDNLTERFRGSPPETPKPTEPKLIELPSKEEQQEILRRAKAAKEEIASTALPQMRSVVARAIKRGHTRINKNELRFFKDSELFHISLNLLEKEIREKGLEMKIYSDFVADFI